MLVARRPGDTSDGYYRVRLSYDRRWVIASERVGAKKPARAVLEHALSWADAPPGESIVIGDLWETDIEGAIQMGIDAVWLNRDESTRVPTPGVFAVSSLLPSATLLRVFRGGV